MKLIKKNTQLHLDHNSMKAVTSIVAMDATSAILIAKEKITRALDVVRYCLRGRHPYNIDNKVVLVFDDFGHARGGSYSGNDAASCVTQLDLDCMYGAAFAHLDSTATTVRTMQNNNDRRQLEQAFRSLKLAEEATLPEDCLSESWIALESILGQGSARSYSTSIALEKMIAEIISVLTMDEYRTLLISDIFEKIGRNLRSSSFGEKRSIVLAPPAILSDFITLSNSSTKHLSVMLDCVTEIAKYMTASWLKFQADRVVLFFNDPIVALNSLYKIRCDVSGEVALIYQIRNGIFHEGRFDQYIIPYFSRRSSYYARALIWRLIQPDRGATFLATLQSAKKQMDQLLVELAAGKIISLIP